MSCESSLETIHLKCHILSANVVLSVLLVKGNLYTFKGGDSYGSFVPLLKRTGANAFL